ncbi:hypothetical protein H0H93_006760 [Arthromyces matolae]|nr:hypothetical protein H0H93_006760 [Arthromyces matolae]
MTIDNPTELINERPSYIVKHMTTLKKRVGEHVQQQFQKDPKLTFMSADAIHQELMENIDRFPVIERIVDDVQSLKSTNSSFAESIRSALQDFLRNRKDQEQLSLPPDGNDTTKVTSATPSTNRPSLEPVSSQPSGSAIPTPADPLRDLSNPSVPPPITKPQEQLDRALEGNLEKGKTVIDRPEHSEPPTVDVEMADESNPLITS